MTLVDHVEDSNRKVVATGREQNYPRLVDVKRGVMLLRISDRSAYWVASSVADTDRFAVGDRHGRDRLLVTEELEAPLREFLEALFQEVVSGPRDDFLPISNLREVLASPNRGDLAVGALVSAPREVVVMIRGNLERTVVPWTWFRATPNGAAPDFDDVEVVDSGLTLRLGQYEAAVDAILYELDRAFRTRERQRRLDLDQSFGAAMRRLRLQKGVARADFPDVSDKEIARIERGEVERPHGPTLRAIADRLGVEPADIETY